VAAEDLSARPSAAGPGGFGKFLRRMLGKHASIDAIDSIGDRFRLVTLQGPALCGVAWTPGQKLQIAMGSSFAARTYTPIEWDAEAGRTRILGYAHGEGPGSNWLLDARVGDECDFFGPGNSLDVRRASGQFVTCGDETSIGLAYALSCHAPANAQRCLFEVNDLSLARDVLARMNLPDAELFERVERDAHLDEIEQRVSALAATGSTFILTGRSVTIQRLHRKLKSLGVASSQLMTKPYWAPGRAGLD
jgi:NADPH-dependent ferric siderophore reductase